jgi:hypothetical protein
MRMRNDRDSDSMWEIVLSIYRSDKEVKKVDTFHCGVDVSCFEWELKIDFAVD